LTYSAAPE